MSVSLLPELLQKALARVDPASPVWLVGGAVRDYFLQRKTTDFDLVSEGNSLALARALADAWSGDYYTLDQDRETGRALVTVHGQKLRIDIARLDPDGINTDLAKRDFTVNALAVRISEPGKLIDPTGGLPDLKKGLLRACAEDSIGQDPLRALRAARLASQLGFRIDAGTQAQAREAVHALAIVSGERRRDELFRILELDRPAAALRVLHHLGLLEPSLLDGPSLDWLGAEQGISLVEDLTQVLELIAQAHDPEGPGRLVLAEASLKLGRYRPHLIGHFGASLAAHRTRRESVLFGALLLAGEFGNSGRAGTSWPGAAQVADGLRLSNRERTYLQNLKWGTSSFDKASYTGASPVEIYRYFLELGAAGIDAAVLWLAMGLSGRVPEQDAWVERVAFVREHLAAWYEGEGVDFSAPDQVTGDDLIAELGMRSGPSVGELLAQVREGLAVGAIKGRDEALEMARARWNESEAQEPGGG